jgi:membrane associated rhomboid family serine protease
MSGQGGYQYYRPNFFRGFSLFPPVIKWLFVSNIAAWLLLDILLAPFRVGGIPLGGPLGIVGYFLSLWPLGENFWPWQLFTYMFLHGGFFHLFFNMLALWMFGMELENLWGSRKFLLYYLLCGFGAGIANLLVAPIIGLEAPTVGASGAVFGVLLAFGMLYPQRPIYIYFLLPIPAKFFVAGYIGMELFYGVAGTSDGVAHFAHLGGAAVGFVYMLADLNLLPIKSWWRQLTGGLRNPFARPERYVWRDGRTVDVHEAKYYDIGKKEPKDEMSDVVNQEIVDAILDKIGRGQPLTEKEKQILIEASKKIH